MTGRKMTEDDLKKMPEKEKEQLMEQLRILWYEIFVFG